MELNKYQELAKTTAIYPGRNSMIGLFYVTFGLNGEAGEVAEKVKKLMREEPEYLQDHLEHGAANEIGYPLERREQMFKELGDVLWYLALAADELGYTLEEVAFANIEKLKSRQERNMLHGNGDDR